jgi:bacillolysin
MKQYKSLHKFIFLALAVYLLFDTIVVLGQNQEQLGKFKKDKKVERLIMNKKGIPNFIEGNLNPSGIKGNKEEQSLRFFEENKGIFGMQDPRNELKVIVTKKDNLGNTHIKLSQYYHGIRVYGSEFVSHFDKNDELRIINGEYLPKINTPYSPAISKNQAETIAIADFSLNTNFPVITGTELVIYKVKDIPVLTWLVKVTTKNPNGRWEYFINALDGSVIYKANRIINDSFNTDSRTENTTSYVGLAPEPSTSFLPDADVIGDGYGVMGDYKDHIDTYELDGLYYLEDNTRRLDNNPHNHNGQMLSDQSIITRQYPSGTSMTDDDNTWDDPSQAAGIDAHYYAGLTYDFLLTQFGRNGYDGNGIGMLSIVDDNTKTNNAEWDGTDVTYYVVTSGYYSLAGGIDVVAHEWGHAVTEFESNLVYESEYGALNESFSDILGVSVGFITGLDPDWLTGENYNGPGVRNLANPLQFNNPDTYHGDYWADVTDLTNDFGGVHTNSGVPNKMFYLLAQGGVHNGISVTGIGISNALNIMYQANAFYWISTTTFETAKEGCISAANDLDGSGNWGIQMRKAWEAVKVGVSPPTIGTITQPTCTVATGSVVLNDLPATGSWTITKTPGGETETGTGTSITISELTAGTYTFTVTDETSGFTSDPSGEVVIDPQPAIPAAPGGVSPQNFCTDENPTVADLNATGTAIKWYTSPTGGTALAPTDPLATQDYYATQTVGECESAARLTVAVTVFAQPTITGTLDVCAGLTTQLTGSGTPAATTPWVSASTGVATVNGTGLVTGVTAGNSVITYTDINGCSITATVTVNTCTKSLNLNSVMLQGLYNGSGTMRQASNASGPQWPAGVSDHITVELHNSANYSTIEYTETDVQLSTTGTASVTIPGTFNGSYFITIKHRNSTETTTASAVSFAGSTINQSFGATANVYGGNLVVSPDGYYMIYGGDVSQDGIVDLSDLIPVGNQAAIARTGYIPEDINGDGLIDLSDLVIVGNLAAKAIGAITP